MLTLTATQVARRFSELLDAIEARGESFLVVRRGRAVARLEPARKSSGEAIKKILRGGPPDPAWATDLSRLRSALSIEERPWSA